MNTLSISSPPPANVPSEQRLQFCVIVIGLAHLLLIFGITVKSPLDFARNLLSPVIEITLATTPSPLAPEEARLLAPENQLSSSPKDSDHIPKTLEHAAFPDQHIREIWQPPQPEARMSEDAKENEIVTAIESSDTIQDSPLPVNEANSNMMSSEQVSSSQHIASLMAELADQRQHYTKLPRKRTVTAAAHASEDAEYLYNWRLRVERIGNLNYPTEAKRLKLHGDVVMMVAVNADGSLRDVQVQQSSGNKTLDQAAMRIVRLSAPFQPLTPEMRETTDVLEIIRTWRFSADQQWSTSH